MLVLQYSKCHNKFEIKCNMTLLQRAVVYIVPMHNSSLCIVEATVELSNG